MFGKTFLFFLPGSETPPDCNTLDNSFNEQESLQSQKSPLSESVDVKPSEMSLPLPLPIGTEDHQMLLPVAGSQSPSSETLLRSAVTGYSEPQFIFLQQLYWHCRANQVIQQWTHIPLVKMNVINQAVTFWIFLVFFPPLSVKTVVRRFHCTVLSFFC